MNAADYYGLDELKRACSGFIQCCVNVDTVCALLATAERYIQYKCTKSLVQKVGSKFYSNVLSFKSESYLQGDVSRILNFLRHGLILSIFIEFSCKQAKMKEEGLPFYEDSKK